MKKQIDVKDLDIIRTLATKRLMQTKRLDGLYEQERRLKRELRTLTGSKSYYLWQTYCHIKSLFSQPMLAVYKITIAILYTITITTAIIGLSIIELLQGLFKKKVTLSDERRALDGITIIIPTLNKAELVTEVVHKVDIAASELGRKINTEILVIDNGSSDQTSKIIKAMEVSTQIEVITLAENIGYGKAINLGVQKAKYNYLYLLNDDMLVEPDTLKRIVTYANLLLTKNKPFFSVTSQIFFHDSTKRREESGLTYIRPFLGYMLVAHVINEYVLEKSSITCYGGGGSSLYNKHIMQKLGLFDTDVYTPLYVEDLDICFNAWIHGYGSYYLPESKVIHFHRSSSKKLVDDPSDYMYKNWVVFLLKYSRGFDLWSHIVFYPFWIIFTKRHHIYACDILRNLKNILVSRLRLKKYSTVYASQDLLRFNIFLTKHE